MCHGGRYGSPLERVGERASKSKEMAEEFHARPGMVLLLAADALSDAVLLSCLFISCYAT